MESGESSKGVSRKRTESGGGSSDSELSEGWNFVDQIDVTSQDTPSSDGESVEIIEAEDESHEHDLHVEHGENSGQLMTKPETTVIPASQGKSEALVINERDPPGPVDDVEPVHEEMFDSSFCWFLFFATSAVLVSNLAFMAAENALDWNVDVNVESPSFLRDLPITPNAQPHDKYPDVMSWTDNEEAVVDTVGDAGTAEEANDKVTANSDKVMNNRIENSNGMWKKQSLKIESHEVGKYFKFLSEVTGSAEAQNKFAQALLILDALHIGLNDLEEVVTEKSELHQVLKKQKSTLFSVLNEVELGVSRSMEKLAANILNKVQKLERKFENQWCKLEKTGYKEELKGLFYDCQENEEKLNEKNGKNAKHFEKAEDKFDCNEKDNRKKRVTLDNYQYEVDKDSTGKSSGEGRGSGEYYKLVKSRKNEKPDRSGTDKYEKPDRSGTDKYEKPDRSGSEKYEKPDRSGSEKYEKPDRSGSDRIKFTKERNGGDKEKVNKGNNDNYKGKGKYFKENNKNYQQKDKEFGVPEEKLLNKPYKKVTDEKHNTKNRVPLPRNENTNPDKSALEIISKYLKENCEKNSRTRNVLREPNYQTLKDAVNEKIRIPSEMFNKMYEKYCKLSGNGVKWDKHVKSDHLKGDFSGKDKHKEKYFKETPRVIEDHKQNVIEIQLVKRSEDDQVKSSKDKVILPTDKSRHWTFAYELPPLTNKTNVSGDWYIKTGESRSKTRWLHHRSDWWFDRASYRRSNSHPPNWFSGKRKNWFFRRAWARQHCRETPHDSWCRLPEEETVTVSKTNSNLR